MRKTKVELEREIDKLSEDVRVTERANRRLMARIVALEAELAYWKRFGGNEE